MVRGIGHTSRNRGCVHSGAIVGDMDLSPFRIERFYAQYEHSTRYMLSSSDCQSRTIAELLELEPPSES